MYYYKNCFVVKMNVNYLFMMYRTLINSSKADKIRRVAFLSCHSCLLIIMKKDKNSVFRLSMKN